MAIQVLRPAVYWVFLLSAIVTAQSTANTITSSTTKATSGASSSSEPAQTHTVSVGKAENKFVPDTILAKVGDVIDFQFFPPNHSVARAPYEHPCVPYELFGVDQVGFFSGFFPVDAILESPPSWKLLINDTDPIFFYCAAQGSCINFAMVGVINPNASVSLVTQKIDAGESNYMVVPGQPLPDSEESPSATTTSSGSSSTSSSTPSSSPTSSVAPAPVTTSITSGHHLATGAIAGIAVGGVIAVVVLGVLLFLLGRNTALLQSMKKGNRASHMTGPPPSQGYDPGYAPPYSPPMRYSSPPPSMGEYKPYGPASPHQQPGQLTAVAELSSPPLSDQQEAFDIYSDRQANDEARRQTITPPPNRHSESNVAQQMKNQPSWTTRPIQEG